jgi:hypothetical protein
MRRKKKAGRTFIKRFLPLLAIVPMLLGANTARARADIGPHPTMDIEFVWEGIDPREVVEATLYLCEDASCAEARPMEQVALQHITCSQTGCESMAYSYGDFNRLVLLFSDRVERESNIFEKKAFDSTHHCIVREHDLWIETVAGRDPAPEAYEDPRFDATSPTQETYAQNSQEIVRPYAILGLIVMGLLMLVVVRVRGLMQAEVRSQRVMYVGLWIAILAAVLLGGLYSLALPLTLLLEVLVVLVYTSVVGRRRLQWTTVVAILNLITQPIVWLVFESTGVGPSFALVVGTEMAVWLLEGGVLYWALRGAADVRETLLLSLLMSGVSYAAGLFIQF